MVTEWDKLAQELHGCLAYEQCVKSPLFIWNKVRTEGNKLQEENKVITNRMDNLQFCLDHCAETAKELEQKLSAVRTLAESGKVSREAKYLIREALNND